MLKFHPAVCAVENNYQIIVTTKSEAFVSIQVGDEIFIDDSNGILKSQSLTHKITVPQKLLNEERVYTVIEKPIVKRLPYYTKTKEDKLYEYDFRPLKDDNIRCVHIADAHSNTDGPINAATKYGKFNFLIFNGDMPEDSGNSKNYDSVYEIASVLSGGKIPIVFTRGNHDLRGELAEEYINYFPDRNGKTYYSFRLGKIWGLCLDCGEDKNDDNEEYGNTVACHQFRLKQTEYIKQIIENSKNEYDADGVEIKLIISHLPFSHRFPEPFDIEEDIFTQWCRLIKDNIQPDFMLCGHTHRFGIYEPGDEYDDYGLPCTMIIGSEVINKYKDFGAAGIKFCDDKTIITFIDDKGNKKINVIPKE